MILVTGASATGKTTLAHRVARLVGAPVISRDEIKEGLVAGAPDYVPPPGDPLDRRTYAIFFDVLDLLVGNGVTVVAEAAFQDRLWRPGLAGMSATGPVVVIECVTSAAVVAGRIDQRAATNPVHRHAHARPGPHLAVDRWQGITLAVPKLAVDTTDGYRPGLDAIVDFVRG